MKSDFFRIMIRQFNNDEKFMQTTICDIEECNFNTDGICSITNHINKINQCQSAIINMEKLREMWVKLNDKK